MKRRTIIYLVFLPFLLFLIFVVYKQTLKKDDNEILAEDNFYKIESRIENIASTNIPKSETMGWLRVQGTNIDLPVLNITNSFSDDHTLNYAWVSNFYFEGDNRKVIYGHNIRNVGSDPLIFDELHTRFEHLPSFVYHEVAKNNLYIQLSENGADYLYKIYAIGFYSYSEEPGDSYIDENLEKYIKIAKENSIYEYDIEVDKEDELISLVTCTRYFGRDDKTQIRIDARRLRENEKINQYSVATNSFYDIMK